MRASHPRWLRYVAPFALGVLGLAACETYLTDPVEGDAGDPPILVDVRLEPSSVDVSVDEALATAAIGARASGGLSGVSVVLRSPSGAERLECGAEPPTTGTVFDGEWRCDLAISPTAEAGLWRPDSVALRPIGAPARWFTGAQLASLGVEPALAVTFAPGEPTSLRIEVDTLVLRTLAPRTLGVRVEDAFGRTVPGAAIAWASSDPSTVSVSADGVVRPARVGRSLIVASLGSLADTVVIEVPSTPTTLELRPDPVTLDFVGAERPVEARLFDQFRSELVADPVDWSTSDPSVASVDGTGRVRGVGAGATTLRAESRGVVATARIEVEGAPLPPGFTWTNPAGGRWGDPDNWDRGSVPTGLDTARIAFTTGYVVQVEEDAAIGVLRVEGDGARGAVRLVAGRLAILDRGGFAAGSTLELDGGALRNDGVVVVEDTLRWRAGAVTGSGSARLPGSGTLDAPGSGDRALGGGRLQLAGVASVDGGTLSLDGGAGIEVEPGATLTLGTARIEALDGAAVSVEIAPEAALVALGGPSRVGARLVNRGRVEVASGATLETGANGFEGAGVWSLPAGATWRADTGANTRIDAGGRVEGSGDLRIPSSVQVNGVLAPGGAGSVGTLRIEGGLRLGALGTLAIDAGGPGASDLLEVTGTAVLGGTLAVRGVGGWVPAIGDTVEVVRWGSRTGDFSSVTGLSLGAGQPLEANLTTDALVLAADDGGAPVNQPPTAAITSPTDGATITAGEAIALAGSGTDPEQGALTGASLAWTSSLDGALGTGESVAGVVLSTGAHEIVLTATDSEGATGADTVVVTVEAPVNQPPTATITSPTEGQVLTAGAAIALAGSGTDPEDGALTGASLAWTSSLDGALGTGESVAGVVLSTGVHEIVLTATDSEGAIGADTVSVTVETPVLPPLTGTIVFVSERGGRRDLWQTDLTTGTVTQLTSNFRFHARPEVSPTGDRIVFADNADEVLIVDSDGSNERSVTGFSASVNAGEPAWTPDGQQIVYQGIDTDFEIVRVPLSDTSARVFLTSNTFQDRYPKVSPDGTRVAYVEDIGTRQRVTTINTTDGGAPRTLTFGFARFPDWSPDGSEIVYSEAVAGGAWNIQIVDATTGAVRVLVDDGATNWYPAYSPDGFYIVYGRTPSLGSIDFELWAVPADGSGAPFPIDTGTGGAFEPDWVTGLTAPPPPANTPPTATITSPPEGDAIGAGEPTTLAGTGSDAEDGALTGASLVWTSSLDGALGTGNSIPNVVLSSGEHEIVLTATDSEGATGADTVNVTVEDPLPEADLSITLAVAPDPVTVGDTLAHTVTVRNDGPADSDSVEVTLLVDGETLFAVVAEEGCGNFTAPGQRLLRCSIGGLASGAERVLSLRVLPQQVETLTSTAEIAISTGVVDPDSGDRSAVETTTVEAAAPPPPPPTGVIVFVSDRSGNRNLWQRDLGTGVVTQLTFDTRETASPRVSPGGDRIAISDNAFEVLYVEADGTGAVSLTGPSLFVRAAAPAWSADGQQVVYQSLGGSGFNIARVPLADTTARVLLTGDGTDDTYPRVSPDGTRIAYAENDFTNARIVTIDFADGGARQVHTAGIARYPNWSPDGSEIVYSEARNGQGGTEWAIEVVDVATGDIRVLVDDAATNWYPVFSPDGAYVLFARTPGFGFIEWDLWAVPADGSGPPFPIEEGPGNDLGSDWVTGLVLPAPPGG